MLKHFIVIICIFCIFFISSVLFIDSLQAGDIPIKGQLSGWFTFNDKSLEDTQIGLRYMPEMRVIKPLENDKEIDTEIALNFYASTPLNSSGNFEENAKLEIYRLWVRYSSAQFESRLGLQKINFGPARLLRTLMWFDHLDIRDPLQLTEGVKAFLGRYYFLNNANIWIWGLFGNNDLKGTETFATDKDKIEFGGRCQFPLSKGELAFSYHRRDVIDVDANGFGRKIESKSAAQFSDGLENRYAVDGSWDIGIGLWFEACAEEIKLDSGTDKWQKIFTIGADYTFKSGIHLIYEDVIQLYGPKIDQSDETNRISALSVDYRFGLIDSINTIGYYDYTQEDAYYYMGWQRTYDNWQFNLMAFSHRENDFSPFSGKGIQCMIIYNH